MKAKQQCGSQPSQWRLKDFILWVLVSYQAKNHFTNSSSCVPAFQPSIFSPDPTYFPACHTAQSCTQALSQSFWSHLYLSHFCYICPPLYLIDTFHITTEGGKKGEITDLFTSLCLLLSVFLFFTFPALFLSLSFSVCLLCSTYASQQSRFSFLRL